MVKQWPKSNPLNIFTFTWYQTSFIFTINSFKSEILSYPWKILAKFIIHTPKSLVVPHQIERGDSLPPRVTIQFQLPGYPVMPGPQLYIISVIWRFKFPVAHGLICGMDPPVEDVVVTCVRWSASDTWSHCWLLSHTGRYGRGSFQFDTRGIGNCGCIYVSFFFKLTSPYIRDVSDFAKEYLSNKNVIFNKKRV